MANLTARFQLIDQMSQKMADIANNGESMLSKWESAGDAASAALDGISSSASNVAAAARKAAGKSSRELAGDGNDLQHKKRKRAISGKLRRIHKSDLFYRIGS